MQTNPNTYGMTATEKIKSKVPGTVEHKITHPTHGAGHLGTGHTHTGVMSGHTNMGHQPMVGGPVNTMGGHTGLAHATVGPTVPGAIGSHPVHPAGVGHHGMGMGHHHGAVGSTAGMTTTQKIASKIPGTSEYKLTH
ncbi:hypothetical protein WJX74_002588 [Apatococcus lobatus]|uniref:Uncharacterized protein n=1 Tax=Apatococcus lobatus TaxID=904363 RepID=A0AAW1RPJ1_9CHLO